MKSRAKQNEITDRNKSLFGRIIVFTGARQTGKTTLAKKCFPEYAYISIEDPTQRGQYKMLTSKQWKTNFPIAIIDEIQKEPILIESIKAVYDQFEEPKYILLGSSQLLLMEKVRESLAGRCHIIELFTLTIPELLTSGWDENVRPSFLQLFLEQKITVEALLPNFKLHADFSAKIEMFDYYLKFGGYPALSHDNISLEDRYLWLEDYVKTYLERDIKDIAEFRNLEPFVKVQKLLASNTGNILNYSKLANESGVTLKTVQKFIMYLEISYQVLQLQPWHRNEKKRLVKAPKIHFFDPGITRTLLNKRESNITGNEYESAIVTEIYKQIKNMALNVSMYHLRTQDGREIDLLIETEFGYIPIEIKMSLNVVASDARHLHNIQEILDKPIIHSFILSNDIQIKKIAHNITAMPAAQFLANL